MAEKTQLELAFIATIVELIARYGIPGLIEILSGLKKKNITLEDIQALKNIVKDPEDYFA